MAIIRHDGTHYFFDVNGEPTQAQFEVFIEKNDKWYWRLVDDPDAHDGPFDSSYAAYINAQADYASGRLDH